MVRLGKLAKGAPLFDAIIPAAGAPATYLSEGVRFGVAYSYWEASGAQTTSVDTGFKSLIWGSEPGGLGVVVYATAAGTLLMKNASAYGPYKGTHMFLCFGYMA